MAQRCTGWCSAPPWRSGETLAVLAPPAARDWRQSEIGALLGAHVVACASSPEKLALARRHGAQAEIDYSRDDLRAALKRVSDGRGIDVLYDTVGGAFAEPAVRSMGWEGRYLVIGFAGGDIPKIPLNLLLLKGCDLRGVHWGEFVRRDPAGHCHNMERLLGWAAEGHIRAHVHAEIPAGALDRSFCADRRAQGPGQDRADALKTPQSSAIASRALLRCSGVIEPATAASAAAITAASSVKPRSGMMSRSHRSAARNSRAPPAGSA